MKQLVSSIINTNVNEHVVGPFVDSNVRRVKIRLNLNKNFVIITCDNLIETQTFNHYDARSINSEIKMMTMDIHSINIAC